MLRMFDVLAELKWNTKMDLYALTRLDWELRRAGIPFSTVSLNEKDGVLSVFVDRSRQEELKSKIGPFVLHLEPLNP